MIEIIINMWYDIINEFCQKWINSINNAKNSFLQLLSKKEQQEAEREEYKKQLEIEKEKMHLIFINLVILFRKKITLLFINYLKILTKQH